MDLLNFGTYPLFRFYEHDFISLLPDPDKEKAWAYWESINYDMDSRDEFYLETAKIIVDTCYRKESVLWKFIKAFNDNPKSNLNLLFKNAGEACEKAGELKTAEINNAEYLIGI